MKKALKVILCVALILLGIFLADQGLRLILDAPLNTCRKAYDKLHQADPHILAYKNDKWQGERDKIPIKWSSVESEFRVEKDKAANTITFYCYDGRGCCGGQYYSKHIFVFDPDGNLTVYCVLSYNDHQKEATGKSTYKVCCLDKANCIASVDYRKNLTSP